MKITKENLKSILDNTLNECIFLSKTEADNKIRNVLKILIGDGQFDLETSLDGSVYSGYIFYDGLQQISFTTGPEYFHNISHKKKEFNFDIINRSLTQLNVLVTSILIYNQQRGYVSVDKLHEDLADLNYLMSKVNAAAKYETK